MALDKETTLIALLIPALAYQVLSLFFESIRNNGFLLGASTGFLTGACLVGLIIWWERRNGRSFPYY